jgi:hypothetical protein
VAARYPRKLASHVGFILFILLPALPLHSDGFDFLGGSGFGCSKRCGGLINKYPVKHSTVASSSTRSALHLQLRPKYMTTLISADCQFVGHCRPLAHTGSSRTCCLIEDMTQTGSRRSALNAVARAIIPPKRYRKDPFCVSPIPRPQLG